MPNEIKILQFARGVEEAKWVAADIAARIKNGEAPENIAVLARAASHLEPVALELKKNGVPIFMAQTAGLLRTRAVIDVLALLRAALERGNSNAWYQLCLTRISQITPNDLVVCVDYARRKNWPLSRVMLADFPPELSETARVALQKLATDTKLTKEFLASNKPSVVLYQLLEQSGYFKIILNEISAGGESAAADIGLINEFLEFVAEWETQHASATPYDFLADCDRLLEVGEEGDRAGASERHGVQLLTVHASKGLEFSTVYVVSMIEGRFPGTERAEGIEIPDGLIREKTINENHHTEEERRLAYVAFTRAKENLFLTYAEKYSSADGARTRKPSRFISESGIKLVTPVGAETQMETLDGIAFADASLCQPTETVFNIPSSKKEEYSFTQLKAYENCPYQYWFSHVLKLPVRQKWTMNFGKSIHSALEQWYKLLQEKNSAQQASLFDLGAAPEDKSVPPVEKFLEILRRVWIPDGYPSAEMQTEKFLAAENMLRGYYRQHENIWRVPAHIEQRFKVAIGGEVVRGSIDRIDIHPSGEVEIVDYKTGEPKDADKIKFADKEQLLLYQVAAERQLQLKPTLLTYYYLQNNSAVTFTATAKDTEKAENNVAEITTQIKTNQFPPTPSPYTCKNCDYKDICPHRQL